MPPGEPSMGSRTLPKVVYTDLDGTLLGRGGSLFRDAAGGFTLAGAQALGLISSAGAELAFISGRSARLLGEDARVMGAGRFIAEAGCLLVRDGSRQINCAPFGQKKGVTVFEEITATGAPRLLFERFGGALAYHEPWHSDHEYTHLMRGCIDTREANRLLAESGLPGLKVVDNGIIEDRGYGMKVKELHAYHLAPRAASKGSAIELDLKSLGYTSDDAVACGDSDQDLEMARAVRTLYLVSNVKANCSRLEEHLQGHDNVVILEAPMVEGFLEAMRREFA